MMESNDKFVPEVKTLEQIPMDSEEGFILKTLRTVEDIENRMGEKDVYTNKNIPIFLSDYFDNLRNYTIQATDTVLFPKDKIIQLSYYIEKVLKKILDSPKFKIEKVETSIHFSRVKNLDSKAMVWLGKQPGRTLREKIGRKEKVRTKVSRYSYQTKENAVVVALLDILLPILGKRIDKYESEFKESVDTGYHELCKYYLDIKRRYRNSDLEEVVGKFDNNPNNTLINDRNYSVIYRAYRQLKHYDKKIKKDWEKYQERFVWSIFMGIAAKLENTQELYFGNEVFNLEDKNGSIDVVNRDGKFLSEVNLYLPGEAKKDIVKATVFFKKEGEFLFLKCPEKNISKIFLGQNTIKKKEFADIKVGDVLSIEYNLGKKGYQVTKLVEPQSRETYKVTLKFNKNKIVAGFCEKKAEFEIRFNKKNQENYINIFLNGKKIGRNAYDCNSKGYNMIVDFITKKVKSELELKITDLEATPYIQLENKGVGIDFTSYNPVIHDGQVRDNKFFQHLKVMKGKWKKAERYFNYDPRYNYNDINEVIPMNEVFFKNTGSNLAFEKTVDSFFSKSGLNPKGYFTFLVPDNLDEFEQRPLKVSIGSRHENSFPAWRSVAAAISSYQEKKFLSVDENVLVVDLNTEPICITQLKLIERNDKKKIFEHYPCFQETVESDFLPYRIFIDLYVDKITLGMNLSDGEKNNIAKSGIVDKVIKTKKDELYFTGERFIDIIYDDGIYKDLIKKGMLELEDLLKTLQKNYCDDKKVEVLILGSHLNESVKKEIGSKKLVNDDQIVAGAYEISQRLNLCEETWEEYLPNLSLEIIKDGCYGEFPLINNKSITAAHGAKEEWNIEGNLILPSGKKDYKFPLLKQETENKTTLYEAKIESDAFPLKDDLPVKLKIMYTYGMGNNYRLLVYPDVQEDKPFDEIEAKWESLESNIKFNKIDIPSVEFSRQRMAYLKKDLDELNTNFRTFYNNNPNGAINSILLFIKRKKNIIRQARMKYADGTNLYWNNYVETLKAHLYKLYDIFDTGDSETLEAIRGEYSYAEEDILFIKEKKSEKDIITLFLCALGAWEDMDMFKNKNVLTTNDIICIGHLLSSGYDKELAFKLLSPLMEKNMIDRKIGEIRQNWKKRIVIQALSGLIKFNEEFLSSIINEKIRKYTVSDLLIKSLKEHFITIADNIEKHRYNDAWEVMEPYRHGCEVLLYLLNVEDLDFESEERHRLAKIIKKLDRYIHEHPEFKEEYKKKEKIKFDFSAVNREGLENMLSISYVVLQQLIGENNNNLIRVVEVSEDD